MKLDNQTLLSEFYDNIKEVYPHVSFEQVKDICFGPWRFLKNEMESGELNEVRFKYFGVFRVLNGRLKALGALLDQNLKNGHISEDKYERTKKIIEQKLKKNEEDIRSEELDSLFTGEI